MQRQLSFALMLCYVQGEETVERIRASQDDGASRHLVPKGGLLLPKQRQGHLFALNHPSAMPLNHLSMSK